MSWLMWRRRFIVGICLVGIEFHKISFNLIGYVLKCIVPCKYLFENIAIK